MFCLYFFIKFFIIIQMKGFLLKIILSFLLILPALSTVGLIGYFENECPEGWEEYIHGSEKFILEQVQTIQVELKEDNLIILWQFKKFQLIRIRWHKMVDMGCILNMLIVAIVVGVICLTLQDQRKLSLLAKAKLTIICLHLLLWKLVRR